MNKTCDFLYDRCIQYIETFIQKMCISHQFEIVVFSLVSKNQMSEQTNWIFSNGIMLGIQTSGLSCSMRKSADILM